MKNSGKNATRIILKGFAGLVLSLMVLCSSISGGLTFAGSAFAQELGGDAATATPATAASTTAEAPATEAPATAAPATEAPATEAPATDAPATDAPEATDATEAPATEQPAEAPADVRGPLQRAIEDEGGAYVFLKSGRLYKSANLSGVKGEHGDGLAFATAYIVRENGENAVRVLFRTAENTLEQGYLPASRVAGQNRQETIDSLIRSGVSFFFKRNPDLPLSKLAYTPKGTEDTPAEDAPAGDTPAEGAPAEDAPAEDTPTGDAPTDDIPAEDTPAEDVSAEETPAEGEPPVGPTETEVTPYCVRTLKNDVNLRGQASLKAALMHQLDLGTTLTVTAESTDADGALWYRVAYRKGTYYVLAKLVEPAEQTNDAPAADVTTDPAAGESAPVFVAATPKHLQSSVEDNGDGTFTYTAEDGATTLLRYGSVNGEAPAFYPADENGEPIPGEAFPIPLSLTVEDDEPEAPMPFVAVAHEGELPAGITDNGDGYFTYTGTDGAQTLLVYGSASDGDPAFYAVNENGLIDINAPLTLPAVEAMAEINVGFTPMQPEVGAVPEYYLVSSEPFGESAAPTEDESIPAAILRWLFPSASAEGATSATVYHFTDADGVAHYRIYGKYTYADGHSEIGFFAYDNATGRLVYDESGLPILVELNDDLALLQSDEDKLAVLLSMIKALPTPEQMAAMDVKSDAFASAQKLLEQVNTRLREMYADGMLAQPSDIARPEDSQDGASSRQAPSVFETVMNWLIPSARADEGDGGADIDLTDALTKVDALNNLEAERLAKIQEQTASWLTAVAALPSAETVEAMTVGGDDYAAASNQYNTVLSQQNALLRLMTTAEVKQLMANEQATSAFVKMDALGALLRSTPGLALQSGSGGVSVSMEAIMSTPINNRPTGAIGQASLSTRLNSPSSTTDYADVTIPIVNPPAGLSFPGFTNNGSGQYTMTVDSIVLTLHKDANGVPQSITYHLNVGDDLVTTIPVSVPNGYSENPTNVVFGTPVVAADAQGQQTFTGTPTLTGTTLTFVADFGWQDVTITSDKTGLTVVANAGGDFTLSDPIVYTINASNAKGGLNSGVIFTSGQTLSDSITLPAGVAFPAGTAVLSADKKSVSVGGVTVATFSLPVETASISGDTLSFSYAADNATLDAQGDPESGMTAAEISNLAMKVTLAGNKLVVADPNVIAADAEITHTTNFGATPCKQQATAAASTASVNTPITLPDAAIIVDKTNRPFSTTQIKDYTTPITYTLTARNTGILPKSVVVSDAFDANAVYVAGSGSTDVATPSVTATGIAWTATIPAGESRTFTFQVTVKPGTADGTVISNTAKADFDNGKTALSGTVTNTYNSKDNLALVKSVVSTSGDNNSVQYLGTADYRITVTSYDNITSQPHDVVDELPKGLSMTAAQFAAFQAAYPAYSITRIVRVDGTSQITIKNVTVPANGSLSFDYTATVTDKFADNAAIPNTVSIKDGGLNLASEANVLYQKTKALVVLNKTHAEPQKITDSTYQVDYTVTITNLGGNTIDLDDPIVFTDVMTGGLHPVGAGDATTGTAVGTDNQGRTLNGTWVRTGSAAPYTYTITWNDFPYLAQGEVYSVTYRGEVNVTIENGTFDPVTVNNEAKVDDITSGPHPVVIQPELKLVKGIESVNATAYTPAVKSTDLYAGDWVTYTVTLQNVAKVTKTGTLTDTLPVPKKGDFAWQYGVNVLLVDGTAPDGPAVTDGKLTWSNVTLAAGEIFSCRLQLRYPLAEAGFDAEFGPVGSVVTNTASYRSDDGNLNLTSSATHTVLDLEIPFTKTADKANVDGAATDPADKQIVFTLSGFQAYHPAENMSLTDNLADVRDLFEITAIGFGDFTIKDMDDTAVGYTLVLTFDDNSTLSVPVPAGQAPTVTYPTGKTIANVSAVQWQFGDVRTLVINTDPTITVTAKSGVSGTVTNDLSLAYNLNHTKTSATVAVTDSNTLSKRLYDKDGNLVDDTNVYASPNQTYTYVITLINTTQDAMDLTGAVITETIRVGGLDVTKDLALTATGGGVTPASATVAAADWADGAFTVPLTGGALQPGDKVTLSFDVTTSDDFRKSTDATTGDPYKLNNEVAVTLANGAGEYTAVDGPHSAGKVAYLYLQKSVVGYGVKGDGAVMYFSSPQMNDYTTLAQLPGSPNMNEGLYIIYHLALVNSSQSTVSFNLPAGTNFSESRNGYFISRLGYVNTETGGPPYYFYETTTDHAGNIPTQAMGTPATTGATPNWVDYRFATSFSADPVELAAPVTLQPGQGIEYVYAEKIGSLSASTLTNTIRLPFLVGEESTSTPYFTEADTKVYVADMELNPKAWSNSGSTTDPFDTAPGYSSVHGDCTLTETAGSNSKALVSSVSIKTYSNPIALTKTAVGSIPEADITALLGANINDAGHYVAADASQLTELAGVEALIKPIATTAPGLSDYLVWDVEIKNTGTTILCQYRFDDYIPAPYELFLMQITNESTASTPFYPQDPYSEVLTYCPNTDPVSTGTAQRVLFGNHVGQGSTFRHGISAAGFVPSAILPGQKMTIRIIAKPRTSEPVEYKTYENRVQITTLDNALTITRVDAGKPLYRTYTSTRELYGVEASDGITIGGKFASTGYVDVTNAAGETASGKTASLTSVGVERDGTFTYTLNVESKSNSPFSDFKLIERLPAVSDVGALNTAAKRGSQFDVAFAGGGVTAEISTDGGTTWTTIPAANVKTGYTAKAANSAYSAEDWAGTSTWNTTPADGDDSLRIELLNYTIPAGAKLRFKFDAVIEQPDTVSADQIAWNSFGYTYSATADSQTATPMVEATQVGVRVVGAYVTLGKVDENGNALAGAEFGVYPTEADANAGTNRKLSFTTDALGVGKSELLAKQIWYVKEITAPTDYLLSAQVYTADLTNAANDAEVRVGDATGIVNTRTPLNLKLTKALAAGVTAPADGTKFTLRVKGVFAGDTTESSVTRTFTYHTVPAINECDGVYTCLDITGLVAGNVYTLTETVTGSGGAVIVNTYRFTASGTDDANNPVTVGEDGTFQLDHDATLNVVNDTISVQLFIVKKVVGHDSGATFDVKIEGDFTDQTAREKVISIPAADRTNGVSTAPVEVPGVKAGQAYTISEISLTGYTMTLNADDSVAPVTISAGGSFSTPTNGGVVTINVVNTRDDPGQLTIQKTVDGATPTTGEFVVDVEAAAGSFTDDPAKTKETVTLNAANGYTVTLDNLVEGALYTLTEQLAVDSGFTASYKVNKAVGNTFTLTLTDVKATVDNSTGKDLSVSKVVSGNMGDRTRYFTFDLTLTGAAGNMSYDVDLTNATAGDPTYPNPTALTTDATGTGTMTFYLKHGQSVTVKKVPKDAAYTVTETAGADFTVTYRIGATGAETNGLEATGTMPAEALNVRFTNRRDTAIPTGVLLDVWPYLLIVAAAGVALLLLLLGKKRRRSNRD